MPGVLSICELKMPHLLMGTSDSNGDNEHENYYCKVQFAEGCMGDQPKEDGFGGQGLIFRGIGVWIPILLTLGLWGYSFYVPQGYYINLFSHNVVFVRRVVC